MSELVVRVGSRTAQGLRPNNEDALVVDEPNGFYLVADGMGGQERGELASGMAAELIPRVVRDCLAAHDPAEQALARALQQANDAICAAGKNQPEGRRMGTTAVLALHHGQQVHVTHLGDSRAYLIRGDQVQLLTLDHSVAQALVNSGALSEEEARTSPYQHILHRFLGCSHDNQIVIQSFIPQTGDRLLLASDGLTNHVSDDDLRTGARQFTDPQVWVDHLVAAALERGSRDNVTCIIVAFEKA